jgi:quercetin 2,3-dioxygenase
MFEGRNEGTYSLENTSKGVFAYVLTGTFEIQNRLIQPHDGVAIWNIEELEFEALSNRAIIVVAELL